MGLTQDSSLGDQNSSPNPEDLDFWILVWN